MLSLPQKVTVSLPCVSAFPLDEDFEAFTVNVKNNCWMDADNNNKVIIRYTSTTTVNSGTKTVSAGSNSSYTLKEGLKYKFEVWGAQGGAGYYSTANSTYIEPRRGGYGGYSSGYYTPSTNTTVYIYAGGEGTRATGTTNATSFAGGYNGGGNGFNYSGGGGGASHIALRSGLLSTLDAYKTAVLIVAGGGGGGANLGSNTYSYYAAPGGHAGGKIGGYGTFMSTYYNSSVTSVYPRDVIAQGGTQTSGGINGQTTYNSTKGSFGQGGHYYKASDGTSNPGTNYGYGGGGAGYYGGAGGYAWSSGAGGSGFVNESLLTDCQTLGGDNSFPNTAGSGYEAGHQGGGYVKISWNQTDTTFRNACLTNYPNKKVIEMDASSSAVTIQSPVLDLGVHNLNECLVAFKAIASTDNQILEIGAIENGTFVKCGSVTLNSSLFNDYLIALTSYSGSSRIVGFRTAKGNLVYIDSVAVNFGTSTCDSHIPSGVVVVTDPSSSSAVISWNGDSAISQNGGWKVEYGIAGFAQGNGTVLSSITDTFVNITSLTEEAYDVYVTANCGNEYSSPYKVSFKLGCGNNNAMPFYDDFITYTPNESNECWVNVNNPDDAVVLASTAESTVTFSSNSQNTYSLTAGKTYKMEVWGARGGHGYYTNEYNKGGYGAYAMGYYTPSTNTTVYIFPGGIGGGYNYTTASNGGSSTCTGGYNGGGNGYSYSGGGGGATHIAFASGVLTNRSGDYQTQLLLVAAGGGGGQNYSSNNYMTYYHYYSSRGGAGGAYVGQSGSYAMTNNYAQYIATGGTQNSGGVNGITDNSNSHGTFGKGGRYYTTASSGGGGGGFYGGAGGWNYSSGAGGSSFANTSLLTNTKLIGGNDEMPTTNGNGTMIGMNGAGYAKITEYTHGTPYLSLAPSQIVQSPRLNLNNTVLGQYNVSIYAESEASGHAPVNVKIGVMEGSNFVALSTVTVTSTNTYTVSLNTYNGASKVVALQALDNSVKVHNITIAEAATACNYTPTNLNASIDDVLSTVSLTWDTNSQVNSWVLEYGVAPFTQGTGTVVAGLTSPSYNLGNLNGSGVYQVYVYADCDGSGNNNSLSASITFTLPCVASNQFPFNEPFTSYTREVPNECWKDIDYPASPVITGVYTTTSNSTPFNYTNSVQSMNLIAGNTYKLEVWGAKGGRGYSSTYSLGGKGGYSSGYYTPSTNTTIYIHTGGVGADGTSSSTYAGGYNGGGNGYYYSGGGGGATHIALTSGVLTSFSGSYNNNLLIVAGGGGGGATSGSTTMSYSAVGGAGGGVSGVDGNFVPYYAYPKSTGGTQSSGGICIQSATYNGSFGQGGRYYTSYSGGGGGGFYGGAGGSQYTSGAGGSGYVNQNLLTDYTTLDGNTTFPSTSGGTETGHNTSGYAKVSYTYITSFDNYLVLNASSRPVTVQSPILYLNGNNLNQCKVSFKAKSSTVGQVIEVGVIDNNSFVKCGSVTTTSTNFEQYYVTLENYNGTTSRIIAFKTAQGNLVYVDDVNVDTYTQCELHTPKNVAVSVDIYTGNVKLSWDKDDDASITNYTIEYGNTGFAQGQGTTVTANKADSVYTLVNIPSGSYDAYITAKCSNDNSMSSKVSFTLPCLANNVFPYNEPFDGNYTAGVANDCWKDIDVAGNVVVQTVSGNVMLSIDATARAITVQSPIINLNNNLLGACKVTFNAKSSAIGQVIKVGVIDNNSFVECGSVATISNTTFKQYSVTLDSYTGVSQIIAFQTPQGNLVYIDNVNVSVASPCDVHTPENPVANVDLGTGNVTISWPADTTVDNFVIEYGLVGFTLGTGTTVSVPNTNSSYTLTGLSSSTSYDAYIRAACNGNYSMNSGVTFNIPCINNQVFPFYEDFTSYRTHLDPVEVSNDCWKDVDYPSTKIIQGYFYYNDTTYKFTSSGSYSMTAYGGGDYKYTIQAWGAAGGNGVYSTYSVVAYGGKGGYAIILLLQPHCI